MSEAVEATPSPASTATHHWWRRYHYGWSGVLLGLLLAGSSFTPSLLPRTPILQGLVAGVAGSFGYGIGEAIAWAVRRLTHWEPSATLRKRSWLVLGIAGGVFAIVTLLLGWHWQVQIHELMDVPAPAAYDVVLILLVGLLVFVGLVGLGRALRHLSGWIIRHTVGRLPLWLARTIAVVLVTLLVIGIFTGVIFRGLVAVCNAIFSVRDTTTNAGAVEPTAPTRSGSPDSLITWDSLGRQGRNFVGKGPTASDIAAVTGRTALEPIRVYAGLASAPTTTERVDLAVKDLERAGAFDRKTLVIATTTGTGWVDPASVDASEYVNDGDIATVAMQYSYLPSWLSFLVDKSKAEEAGVSLVDGVYDEWSKLPADHRPNVYVFGESLGSFGSQAGFSSLDEMRQRTAGAVLAGTPNFTPLWSSLVKSRDAGSPERLPVYQQGEAVRWAATPNDLTQPETTWASPRVLYLQHASDPIVWWSPHLMFTEPDWLREPRGADVLPAMHWLPWVTFWQVTADMVFSTGVPDSHGHVYQKEYVDAWAAVTQPSGWTDALTTKVRAVIGD